MSMHHIEVPLVLIYESPQHNTTDASNTPPVMTTVSLATYERFLHRRVQGFFVEG